MKTILIFYIFYKKKVAETQSVEPSTQSVQSAVSAAPVPQSQETAPAATGEPAPAPVSVPEPVQKEAPPKEPAHRHSLQGERERKFTQKQNRSATKVRCF